MATKEELVALLKAGNVEEFNRTRFIDVTIDLRKEDLSGLNLDGVDFSRAILEDADFMETRLCGASFSEASLENAQLPVADLRNANFDGANLCDANFTMADLSGAKHLNRTIHDGVNLHGAKGVPRAFLRSVNALLELSLDEADAYADTSKE